MAHIVIRPAEFFRRLGESKSAGYQKIVDGLLPDFIPLGRKARGQIESRVDRIIEARALRKSEDEIRRLVAEMNAGRDLQMEAA